MTDLTPVEERERAVRRRILRQVTLWTFIYMLAAVLVAVIGAALVAFLLTFAGMPFLPTWGVTTLVILVVPLVITAAREIRDRFTGGRE